MEVGFVDYGHHLYPCQGMQNAVFFFFSPLHIPVELQRADEAS